MHRRLAVGLVFTLAASAPLAAQRAEPVFRAIERAHLPAGAMPGITPTAGAPGNLAALVPPWTAPIASALVPGTGQAILHQQRLLVYLAVEGFVWLQYFKDVHDWRQQRAAYRDLAAQVARAPFTANPPVGGWDYYERMEHFLESGVYSLNGSTTNVQPEPDESTYNGAMWLLARQNFWPNPSVAPATNSPQYQQALLFYESRAVTPAYRWSWRNAQLEQDLYRRTINKANDAVRRATSDLGVILANHVLSAVDAFASLQIHAESGPTGDFRIGSRLPLPFR
jgi:hypothetical protein